MTDEKISRGSGMLTDTQRQYLAGQLDVESGSQRERTIRSRMRKRVVNSLLDLAMLAQTAEERDIEQISKDANLGVSTAGDIVGLILTLNSYISPFLKNNDVDIGSGIKPSPFVDQNSVDKMNIDSKQGEANAQISIIEDILANAIRMMFIHQGYRPQKYTADLKVELGERIDSLNEKDLKSVSDNELYLLYEANKIGKDEFYSEAKRRDMLGPEEYKSHRWE